MARAVADTSPLIALNQIGQLDLLGNLFESVLMPPAVAAEAQSVVERPSWLVERALSQPLPADVAIAGLGPGESEAIALGGPIEALRFGGFRATDDLFDEVLRRAGEKD